MEPEIQSCIRLINELAGGRTLQEQDNLADGQSLLELLVQA